MFRLKYTQTLSLALLLGFYKNLTKEKSLFTVKNHVFSLSLYPHDLRSFQSCSMLPKDHCPKVSSAERESHESDAQWPGDHSLLPRPQAARSHEKPELCKHPLPFPPLASPFTFVLKSILKLLLKVSSVSHWPVQSRDFPVWMSRISASSAQGPRKNPQAPHLQLHMGRNNGSIQSFSRHTVGPRSPPLSPSDCLFAHKGLGSKVPDVQAH